MKLTVKNLNSGVLLSMLLCLIFACNDSSENDKEGSMADHTKDKEVLRYLKEVEWPQAYREQDTVLLDRILGDDFKMVSNDGSWSDKAGQMKRIKAAPMDHDSFRYDIKRLEVFPNGTAIIAGTGHFWNDSIHTSYQSSNVLIKRDSLWKAVLSHVSGVKQEE